MAEQQFAVGRRLVSTLPPAFSFLPPLTMVRFAGEPIPSDIRQLADLPYWSELIEEHDPDRPRFTVCLYHCPRNICECKDDDGCETKIGVYVGTDDPFEPKFCPHHYQALHTPPDNSYQMIPMTSSGSE